MLRLVYRDMFIYQRRNLVILPLFAVYFIFISRVWESQNLPLVALTISVFAVTMILQTAFAYDETSKFNKFLRAMPVSPMTIALSRYLTCFGSALMGLVYVYLAAAIEIPLSSMGIIPIGKINITLSLETVLMWFVVVALVSSILVPVMFRFGYQKAKYPLLLLLCVSIGGGIGLSSVELPSFLAGAGSLGMIGILTAVTAIILYGSILLSANILAKQEL